MSGDQLSQITSLLSNDRDSTESNSIFQAIESKLGDILQNQGLSTQKAQDAAPDLINSLKDKFVSNDEANKGFDLGAIADLLLEKQMVY